MWVFEQKTILINNQPKLINTWIQRENNIIIQSVALSLEEGNFFLQWSTPSSENYQNIKSLADEYLKQHFSENIITFSFSEQQNLSGLPILNFTGNQELVFNFVLNSIPDFSECREKLNELLSTHEVGLKRQFVPDDTIETKKQKTEDIHRGEYVGVEVNAFIKGITPKTRVKTLERRLENNIADGYRFNINGWNNSIAPACTSLLRAIEVDRQDLVDCLIEYGADVNLKHDIPTVSQYHSYRSYYWSPLAFAIYKRNEAIALHLVTKHHAKLSIHNTPDEVEKLVKMYESHTEGFASTDEKGLYLFSWLSWERLPTLIGALLRNYKNLLLILLNNSEIQLNNVLGALPKETRDELFQSIPFLSRQFQLFGKQYNLSNDQYLLLTPLLAAVLWGDLEIVDKLINRQAFFENSDIYLLPALWGRGLRTHLTGISPLAASILLEKKEITQFLLQNGANANSCNPILLRWNTQAGFTGNYSALTPLWAAISINNRTLILELLNKYHASLDINPDCLESVSKRNNLSLWQNGYDFSYHTIQGSYYQRVIGDLVNKKPLALRGFGTSQTSPQTRNELIWQMLMLAVTHFADPKPYRAVFFMLMTLYPEQAQLEKEITKNIKASPLTLFYNTIGPGQNPDKNLTPVQTHYFTTLKKAKFVFFNSNHAQVQDSEKEKKQLWKDQIRLLQLTNQGAMANTLAPTR